MGDPRKLRKKYSKPSHPWQKLRIEDEKVLMTDYGFKNKTELWKLNSKLRNFKTQVKLLVPKNDDLAEKQKQQLLSKLQKLKLIQENAVLEDILALTLTDMCERRLQTIVVKKGLARSVRQARQFITHGHIIIGENKITAPNYMVNSDEELMITFSQNSRLHSEDHPERVPSDAVVKEEQKKIQKKVEEKPVETVEKEEEEEVDLDAVEEPKIEIKKEEPASIEELPVEETEVKEALVEEIKEPVEEEKPEGKEK